MGVFQLRKSDWGLKKETTNKYLSVQVMQEYAIILLRAWALH